jgi:apolipoprotein N-acyltransferase
VVRRSQLFTPDAWVDRIAQRSGTTVADRVGAAPEWALTGLGAGAVLAAATLAVRRRRAAA